MGDTVSSREIDARVRAALDESEKETRRLLEHIAHDVRAARRAIGIPSELLLKTISTDDPSTHETARLMNDGLGKMDAVLAGVTDYSLSLQPSSYSIQPVPADLVVRRAMAALDRDIRASGARVDYEGLPTIHADRERLTTVFRHLIDNSLKYRGEAAPELSIAAESSTSHWIFSLKDNCLGIDDKYIGEIFRPFYRLHGAKIPGIGLGLATCQKIVEAHGGAIRLESKAGVGSTVIFTIPIPA